jgi:hypothetical protein
MPCYRSMSALIPFAPSCPQTGSAWFYETDTMNESVI